MKSKSSANASAASCGLRATAVGYTGSTCRPVTAIGRGRAEAMMRSSASASASTSSRVLYIASDARAVPGMPKRSMSGWQQ